MSDLTKASLREALQQKGVPIPSGSPKKEVLARLYRKHVSRGLSRGADDHFRDFSSDEDTESNPFGDNSWDHTAVTEQVSSLSNDDLYEKLRELGEVVGPIVGTTRRLYEKRLQRLLNGQVARTEAREEFSATEEEDIKEDNSDDEDGTPLQSTSRRFFPDRELLNTSSTIQPERRSFEFSSHSVLSKTGAPVQMSLRSRSFGTSENIRGPITSTSGPSKLVDRSSPVAGSRGFSFAVKALIVLAVVAVNVLIYANLEYFKSTVPSVPSVIQEH